MDAKMNCCYTVVLLPVLLFLAGCSSSADNDALSRERASMDSEAKALAAHQAKRMPKTERGPTTVHRDGAAALGGSKLPAGTPIRIIVTQALSTRTASTGADCSGTLAEDLKDANGKVLSKAGSEIKGRVVLVSDGTNLRRKHELEIRVYRLRSASGNLVDIRTTSYVQEGAEAGSKPAIIESKTPLDFQLASAVEIP